MTTPDSRLERVLILAGIVYCLAVIILGVSKCT